MKIICYDGNLLATYFDSQIKVHLEKVQKKHEIKFEIRIFRICIRYMYRKFPKMC